MSKPSNEFYERYIHSDAWKQKHDQRLNIDNHVCQVCGKEATEVHHLYYDNLGHEDMKDLVSLCHDCHKKAEELYDPKRYPWALDEKKPEGNNFMAAMRVDVYNMTPLVYTYIKEVRGDSFEDFMNLRQPRPEDKHRYWAPLSIAVNALCRKRYSDCLLDNRRDIAVDAITNRIMNMCLAEIEHNVRNRIQDDMKDIVWINYQSKPTWKAVAEQLGISIGTLNHIKSDPGPFGPSLREVVLYFCGLDAAAGIRPIEGFDCLANDDYDALNALADYMVEVSGTGAYRGEYKGGVVNE